LWREELAAAGSPRFGPFRILWDTNLSREGKRRKRRWRTRMASGGEFACGAMATVVGGTVMVGGTT
jgi:hypothetical protein